MSNMKYYDQLRQPPKSALKQITGGRMSGKTDINPQWRIEAMTNVFGPCGIGWKYTIDKQWLDVGHGGEVMAFVNVSVYIKVDGVWSDAIPGTGGNTLIQAEKSGLHNNDEGYKMALTDALSVAMKFIGVAGDIYAGGWDGSKYRNEQGTSTPQPKGEISASQDGQTEATVKKWKISAVFHAKDSTGKSRLKIITPDYEHCNKKYGMAVFHIPDIYKNFADWEIDKQYTPKAGFDWAIVNDPKDGGKYPEVVEICGE